MRIRLVEGDHCIAQDEEIGPAAGALDRVLGTLYQAVELFFRPALRIGFASRFD